MLNPKTAGDDLWLEGQGDKFYFGASKEYAIYNDAEDLLIDLTAGGDCRFLNGNVEPQGAGTQDLGTVSRQWGNVWANSGLFLNTSTSVSCAGDITIPDDKALLLGTSQDYRIEWDGDDAVHTITAGDFAFMGGNVGIGTTTPNELLTLEGDISGFTILRINADNNAAVKLDRSGLNRSSEIEFLTNNALNWAVGVGDSDLLGDGSEFFIGQTLGGTNPSLVIQTGGNVGIGTTVPQTKLHIVKGEDSNIIMRLDGQNTTSQYLSFGVEVGKSTVTAGGLLFNDQALVFRTADGGLEDERMRISPDGNVGIGTTAPGMKLHVQRVDLGTDWIGESVPPTVGIEAADAILDLVSTDAGTYGSTISFKQVDGTVYENAWGILRQTNGDGSGDGSLRFTYGTDDDVFGNPALVTFDTDGNVGIGTTTPSVELHVVGTGEHIRFGDGTSNTLNFISLNSRGFIGQQIGAITLQAIDAIPINIAHGNAFGTNTSRIWITTAGCVGLNIVDPDEILEVNGNIRTTTDSDKYYAGTAKDMSIFYDGLDGWIKTDEIAASDLLIECGAEKTIELQTKVFEDLQFPVSGARVPAANAPTWQTFTTNTNEYGFGVDDFIDLQANEIPHWWAEGTNGRPHIHVTTKGANATGVNQYAKFTVVVAYADTDEVWTESSFTAELTIPTGTAVLTNFFLDMGGDLVLTNYLIGTQITCRVERIDATSGDPTEYPGEIFITQVGIHLAKDTMGSRQLTVK